MTLTPAAKPSSMGAAAVIGALAIVGVFVWSLFGQDVRLCKRVLTGLIQGNQSVRNKIDWAHFIALGMDVGAIYAKLPDAKQQAMYQQGFVLKFAEGFAESKADPAGFTDWQAQADGTVTVEYPAKSKTALFRLSENGKQVAGLAWK
jgi:hypothetical protein